MSSLRVQRQTSCVCGCGYGCVRACVCVCVCARAYVFCFVFKSISQRISLPINQPTNRPIKKKEALTSFVTAFVGVVVLRAGEKAVEGMEPPVVGQELLLVEAQVPLAHEVCGVPRLLQLVCYGGTVGRQRVGLGGPDDLMLKT